MTVREFCNTHGACQDDYEWATSIGMMDRQMNELWQMDIPLGYRVWIASQAAFTYPNFVNEIVMGTPIGDGVTGDLLTDLAFRRLLGATRTHAQIREAMDAAVERWLLWEDRGAPSSARLYLEEALIDALTEAPLSWVTDNILTAVNRAGGDEARAQAYINQKLKEALNDSHRIL